MITRAAEKKPLGVNCPVMEIDERVLASKFEDLLPHLDKRRPAGAGRGGAGAGGMGIELVA